MDLSTQETVIERRVEKRASQGLLERAFALEANRLDGLRTNAWLALGFATLAASLPLSYLDRGGGLAGAAVGVAICVWFLVRRRATSPSERRLVQLIDVLFEVCTMPATVLLLAIFTGRAYAFNGFGPTLIFGGIMIMSLLHLQPVMTALVGVGNAIVLFLVAVAVSVIDPPQETDAGHFFIGIGVRSICLGFAGLMGATVSHGLRQVTAGVVRSVRERDLFGKYRLERKLAAGGMGEVWAATYAPEGGFERPAAVKLIHAHLAVDETFVNAFRVEAALCARLVHDAIVQVFDFGRVEDRYFLAMERVDGLTLARLMSRQREQGVRAPDAVTRDVGSSLLAALGFAHEDASDASGHPLHIVHRDVAPSNVLLSWRGAVKLTDFGIAKALGDAREAHTESVVGHVDHMAPEQVNGGGLDARTDLFCAGAILWELVCARSLFRRANEAATISAVDAAVVPPPSSIDPALAHWDAFFVRALSKDPAARFQRASEMASALEQVAPAAPHALTQFIDALIPLDAR